ncbi:MAG: hypothetical protein IT464_12680 [Planctomycetes bacterium]|nr:hypothetical protein [Planctomycetota bacterium]
MKTGTANCIALVALVAVVFACPGCITVDGYDEQSELHAMQAVRNAETDLNGGLTDAQIDEQIANAWKLAGAEGAPSAEFKAAVRAWALTDFEREKTIEQATAWWLYEAAKRPPETGPPTLKPAAEPD